jgi:hypothetical protein
MRPQYDADKRTNLFFSCDMHEVPSSRFKLFDAAGAPYLRRARASSMKKFSEWNQLSRRWMKSIDLIRQSGTWHSVNLTLRHDVAYWPVHGWNNRESLWIADAYVTP